VTTPPRERRSTAQRLTRLQFTDPDAAASLLVEAPLALWDARTNSPVDHRAAALVAALGRVADPDGCLGALAGLVAGDERVRAALLDDPALRGRLLALCGVSITLREHLVAHPGDWPVLAGRYDTGGTAARLASAAGSIAGIDALRRAYRRELIAIAGRDLAGDLDLSAATEALADLAGHTLQAALDLAAASLAADAAPCRLAIIALGKAGGRELNYVSDVDVVFVAEPAARRDGVDGDGDAALTTATTLAQETMRICRAVAWEVDAGLRPEGKDGPLVRTLASHEAYYRRWASTWEFQALLKARPVAGDPALGQAYLETVRPLVWTAAERPNFVEDVRAMRRRVLAHVQPAIADRELKLGPGGLRDVEFAVQLLQLVHGRGEESLQVPGTLDALAALRDGGFVGRDDAVSLIDAYTFLRATEHRLQLRRLRRTHLLPEDRQELSWLARSMGYRPDARGDARQVWEAERALHTREVRRLHEKLFYRPLLEAVARVPADALRLTPAEAGRRLSALGFADPAGSLRHIESLTAGLSRRAALQRALLPVILSHLADAPDPDGGLLAYRRVSEELGASPWYLRLLRDEGTVATRLAFVLGTSRYVGRMLLRAPDALRMLADDDELRDPRPDEIAATMAEAAARQDDDVEAVRVVRGLRRTELLRTAFADLLGRRDVVAVCRSISAITEATVQAALQVAFRSVAATLHVEQLPFQFAVIAVGRLGGHEAGYGSDADVLFVYDDADADLDVGQAAQQVAVRLRTLLSAPSAADPPLGIDADLRPEGRDGPLVRSLASYERYYARWSSAWEAQALLRARFCAGDALLGDRFTDLIDPVRYPKGVGPGDIMEIRRLKARIDTERLPRGADPSTHAKLGRGGLADVEWTIQLLQLVHGHDVEALRTTSTLDALAGATAAGLLTSEQSGALAAAWRQATAVRNAVVLARDRPGDQLPHQGLPLRAVGRVLGYPPGFDPGEVLDDYRRTARHARSVVEAVFYA
jgi:[glutamine synthetase] adenylyltransferase / [glutamine synthetase]-adenylyl-L-tyrosine phosphorylase